MICKACNIKNNEGNKFCTNCGEELVRESGDALYEDEKNISTEKSIQNECPGCGIENEPENKFCVSCGHHLQVHFHSGSNTKSGNSAKNVGHEKKSEYSDKKGNADLHKKQIHMESKRRDKRKRKSTLDKFKSFSRRDVRMDSFGGIPKALWITTGVIVAAIIIASAFDLIFHKYPAEKKIPAELKSINPAVEAKVYEIASKFVCSCGTCNEESLEVCKCERAVDERQFIREYLEQPASTVQKTEDIIIAVANKYGWLKAGFASDYNIDPSKVWNPDQLKVTKSIIPPAPGLINTKAGISDKYTIYSAFNCPCGKCGIDELKDCTCNHPNGALEVKRFIDEKINESKYTINEIIGIVDQKYGGKKS